MKICRLPAIRRTAVPLAGALLLGFAPGAAAVPPGPVRASLITEESWARPGQPLTVGIRLQADPGWHTYWKNPGDSGLPTRVQWSLPPGLVAGPLLWPVPERFGEAPVVSYGHAGDTLLLSEIGVPPSAPPGSTLRIAATVQWLECHEVCRPGRGQVELSIPVRQGRPAAAAAALFARARQRLPAPAAGWTLSARIEPRTLRLAFRPPPSVAVEGAHFYPAERALLDHAAPQDLTSRGNSHTLDLARDRNRGAPVERLTGVLVTRGEGGTRAVEIDLTLVQGGDGEREPGNEAKSK